MWGRGGRCAALHFGEGSRYHSLGTRGAVEISFGGDVGAVGHVDLGREGDGGAANAACGRQHAGLLRLLRLLRRRRRHVGGDLGVRFR